MSVRVWGVADDRLIEVRAEPATWTASGLRIVGLPEGRGRTTADRVSAALVNSRVVRRVPPVVVRLEPAIRSTQTSNLDLAVALATLAHAGMAATGLRWIMAEGRLGLDGAVHSERLEGRVTVAEVVGSLWVQHEKRWAEPPLLLRWRVDRSTLARYRSGERKP